MKISKLLVVIFVLAICAVAVSHAKDILHSKIEEYNRFVISEIPDGSKIEHVQSFLDAHKIEHSDYIHKLKRDSAFNKLSHPSKQQIHGYVGAIVRDVSNDALVSWSIQLRFYFDENGKLIVHTVDSVGAGP